MQPVFHRDFLRELGRKYAPLPTDRCKRTFLRRLFPNRIDPITISNKFIGGDERAAELAGRCDDGSVRRVADCRQRHRFEQNIQRICLNLKVRGTFELFGPATKRHVQANNFSFYESVDFFQNDNRHDNGVFALLRLLQDAPRAVSQPPSTI